MQTPDPFTCPYVVNSRNQSEFLVRYNPMATLMNPLGEDTISRLFARGVHREFGYLALWLLLAVYFVGAAWAAGMDISSGLFVPMLLIGAVLGRLLGLAMVDVVPLDPGALWWMPAADAQWKWIDPGVFAVVGAAAFMGGVTRLTIALAAIMMEVRRRGPACVALLHRPAVLRCAQPGLAGLLATHFIPLPSQQLQCDRTCCNRGLLPAGALQQVHACRHRSPSTGPSCLPLFTPS
jgi:Voltage gated chloride channel